MRRDFAVFKNLFSPKPSRPLARSRCDRLILDQNSRYRALMAASWSGRYDEIVQ